VEEGEGKERGRLRKRHAEEGAIKGRRWQRKEKQRRIFDDIIIKKKKVASTVERERERNQVGN
jgi:hypothetical protein